MVAQKSIDEQLKDLSLRFRMFGRAEIRELRRILQPGEIIRHCTYGFYQGGSAILVATEDRLLLVDKRPFYLNLEDMSYALIRDVDISPQFLQATLHLSTVRKRLAFRSISDARLRRIKDFVQQKVESSSEEMVVNPEKKTKVFQPYLNPGWRPHHTSLLPRRRPTKFYAATGETALK